MVSNRSDLKQYEIENAKENRKILNLEKEVLHYKRLCEKQKQKLEQYRVMEIEYKKLQNNFSKSEKVRKQQKKIIDSLRSRPWFNCFYYHHFLTIHSGLFISPS